MAWDIQLSNRLYNFWTVTFSDEFCTAAKFTSAGFIPKFSCQRRWLALSVKLSFTVYCALIPSELGFA
jgi:hypothetical protein